MLFIIFASYSVEMLLCLRNKAGYISKHSMTNTENRDQTASLQITILSGPVKFT